MSTIDQDRRLPAGTRRDGRQDAGGPRLHSLSFAKPPAATRVVAAMSGGVDSTVVAALLKREGYDVVGVTLQLYDHGAAVNKPGACCAGQDIHDARRAADALGVPHYVLDYESRFRQAVMEEFADSYLAGETPIPCVRCNQTVKFADLMRMAKDLGADCLATGHYVRRVDGEAGPELWRAADADRDQSYFLFATTREQLDFLRFPLGGMEKPAVRELAAELGLKAADKPDSQDICFVPSGKYQSVVEKLRPGSIEPGEIVHVDGRVLGEHRGIINFTVGQRRGLGVATGEPLFVVKLDASARRVIVGPREALRVRTITLRDVNWLGEEVAAAALDGREILVRVRSTRPPAPARITRAEEGFPFSPVRGRRRPEPGLVPGEGRMRGSVGFTVTLDYPEEGVAPGQAAVFYERGSPRVLGGGWIAAAE